MVSHYGIFFKDEPPKIDVILEKLKEATGGNVLYSDDTWEIVNPNDPTDGICIYYQDYDDSKGITLTVFHSGMNYLLGATLHVLVALGGNYGHPIPEWTSLKWEDAKKKPNRE